MSAVLGRLHFGKLDVAHLHSEQNSEALELSNAGLAGACLPVANGPGRYLKAVGQILLGPALSPAQIAQGGRSSQRYHLQDREHYYVSLVTVSILS